MDQLPENVPENKEELKRLSSEFKTHPPSSENRFSRFFQKVNSFFSKTTSSNIKLTGRIQELEKKAEEILKDLMFAKESVEREIVEPQFISLLNIAIEPLKKEISRIQRTMENDAIDKDQVAHEVKAFRNYSEWIEKAKRWIKLCSHPLEKNLIMRELIAQAIHEFHCKINRDIKVIEEYSGQILEEKKAEISPYIKDQLQTILEPEISRYLLALHKLKTHPDQFSSEAFHSWKSEADKARQIYFTEALHVIDTFINRLFSRIYSEDEELDKKEVLLKLEELEEDVWQLIESCNHSKYQGDASIVKKIALLEKTAQMLVTPPLSVEDQERIDELLMHLSTLRQQVDQIEGEDRSR